MSFLHDVKAMATDENMIAAMISGRDFMCVFYVLLETRRKDKFLRTERDGFIIEYAE